MQTRGVGSWDLDHNFVGEFIWETLDKVDEVAVFRGKKGKTLKFFLMLRDGLSHSSCSLMSLLSRDHGSERGD